ISDKNGRLLRQRMRVSGSSPAWARAVTAAPGSGAGCAGRRLERPTKKKRPGLRSARLEADPRGLISLRPHPPPIYSVPEIFARPFGNTGFLLPSGSRPHERALFASINPNSRRTASRISGGTEPRPFSRSPAGGTGAPIWGPICRHISPDLQLLQALAVQCAA